MVKLVEVATVDGVPYDKFAAPNESLRAPLKCSALSAYVTQIRKLRLLASQGPNHPSPPPQASSRQEVSRIYAAMRGECYKDVDGRWNRGSWHSNGVDGLGLGRMTLHVTVGLTSSLSSS